MTPEELEAQYQEFAKQQAALSPPPATPTPPPTGKTLGAVNELLETMTMIDRARMQFFEAEQKKMSMLEDRIASRLEEKFAAQLSSQQLGESVGVDPIIVEGAKILLQAWTSQAQAPPLPNYKPIETPKSQTIVEPPKGEIAQPAPPMEVAPVTTYTQDQINDIADKIYEHYPKDVKAFKIGLITREEAIKKIMVAGLSAEDAERVAQAMLDTDYEDGA